jgi:predicted nucleic acid-binding protein
MALTLIRAIIDTNVLFEGLTKQGGACGLIIDAWLKGLFTVCVSTAVEYEYTDVLQRKLSAARWQQIEMVLALLLSQAEWTKIYYSWRPTSPDAGDDLIIDCAMNAGAIVVTSNRKDFLSAEQNLGLKVLSPVEFIKFLTAELSRHGIII